jgi:hypothetical protein
LTRQDIDKIQKTARKTKGKEKDWKLDKGTHRRVQNNAGQKRKRKNIQFSKCTQIFQFDNTDFKLTTTGKCADSYRAQQRRLIGNDITAGWTWPDSS